MTNRLYYGDNLDVLRDHVKDESVDLVYLDPPFNSNATYNVLFKSPSGAGRMPASRRSTTHGPGDRARARR
ncbi:MAG: hypothetical protein ACK5SX_13005 [Sandaracinobacter sp.]